MKSIQKHRVALSKVLLLSKANNEKSSTSNETNQSECKIPPSPTATTVDTESVFSINSICTKRKSSEPASILVQTVRAKR